MTDTAVAWFRTDLRSHDNEAFVRAVQDEDYYERLFTSLEGAFRRAGIPFRRM